MKSHLWRAAIIGIDRPVWPDAMLFLDTWGGERGTGPLGAYVFDPALVLDKPCPPDNSPLGSVAGELLSMDAEGGVWLGNTSWPDGDEAVAAITKQRSSRR